MRQSLVFTLLLAVLFLSATQLPAQTATGVITGSLTDSTGAVIPSAKVTLTDQQTNQAREQMSNESGIYEFRALPRGNYTLSAELDGFKKEEVTGIQLTVAQTLRLDVQMEVGALTEQVTVEATAGLVQVGDANLSQVIDEKRVRELPLNGRNFMQLAFLSSGIVTAGRASATQRQANYGPAFSAGGQRDNTTTVLVDGIEISGMELNNYPYAIPSLESVGEFRVQTSGASAEFGGNSGAFVNVVSRRGSNDLHASLFEFLRNDTLDARNFFDRTGKAAPNKRNQFGFFVSGPVRLPGYNGKDKTFFMGSWEWQRQRNGTTSTALVPTLAERAGDLSASGVQLVHPISKAIIPNNIIPQSDLSSVGRGLMNLYPEPNSPDPARNFVNAPLRKYDFSVPSFRIDHQLTQENNLFWRATITEPDDIGPGQALTQAFPYDAVQTERHVHYALGDVHMFSPTLINEFNVGFVRMNRTRNSADSFIRDWVSELGIQGIPTQPLTYGAPAVIIAGHPQAGFSTNNAFFQWITQSTQFVDNLSMVRGNHTFKVGGNFQKKQLNSTQWGAPNGNYSFTGVYTTTPPVTGSPTRLAAIADTLYGYPATYAVQTTPFEQRFRYSNASWYVQDDWRASPRLTLNFGLRWEYAGKPTDMFDRLATFDLATGTQLFPGQSGVPRNLINADNNNYGPRFGFAWRTFGTDSLVIRGAYGVFYSPPIGNDFRSRGFQDPFAFQVNRPYRPESTTTPIPTYTAQDPTAGSDRQTNLSRAGVDRNLRDAYVQQWNLSIQKLLSTNTLWEVAYRGSKSAKLITNLNYNEINPNPPQPPDFARIFPYPNLAGVGIMESRAGGNYHAMTSRLERRYSNGLTFLANYTFSKTLTDVDSSTVGVAIGAGSFGANTIKNLRDNYGPAVFDRPHQFNLSVVYELPFFKDGPAATRMLLGGWQVAPIWTAYTGAYLTPGNFNAPNTGSRPDALSNPNLSRGDRTIERWFDTDAIRNAQPGVFGNAGKGIIQGSGVNNWDVSISKNFDFLERHRVQFRAEFFNFFNHAQFDDPVMQPVVRDAGGNILNPNAGKVTSASDFGFRQTERVVQFGLKYSF